MSLVETLAVVAVGSGLGFAFSLLAQRQLLKAQKVEMLKERIYSPLYYEIGKMTQDISSREWWPTDEWKRVSEGEHLSYLIGLELLQSLRRFYGQSLETLTQKANVCTNHYPSVVVAEMHRTLVKPTPTTATDIDQLSRPIGWNLHRGRIREHELAGYGQSSNS